MSDAADWSKATDGLGERYNIASMTVKNHGCCGHSFAAIDAALALRGALDLADVDHIEVGTYRASLDVTNRRHVSTPFEGRFSTPFTVASALVHGSVRLNAFTPERLQDQAVQALMARIDMVVDETCEAAFPNRRSATVTITMKDGQQRRHEQPTRKGDPDAPLTDDELAMKFRELASPVIGRAAAQDLLDTLARADGLNYLEVQRLGSRPSA
jgi:2-methylcitrate dehydratase PrpD